MYSLTNLMLLLRQFLKTFMNCSSCQPLFVTDPLESFLMKDHCYWKTRQTERDTREEKKSVMCIATCCIHRVLCSDSLEILADMKVRRLQLMEVNYGNKVCVACGTERCRSVCCSCCRLSARSFIKQMIKKCLKASLLSCCFII